MSDNKRNGRGVFGTGYYIALILCAAAIGTTGYVYNRNANREKQSNVQSAVGTIAPAQTQADIPVIATRPNVPSHTQVPVVTQEQPTQAPSVLKTASPVSGQTCMEYSMEALSYNETTRDWRVHNGVDIAAAEGTEVCAAADGEVYTVYEDDAMGNTVVIRHNGGYTTKYACLGKEICVKAGDKVTMGQQIGVVGVSALVETTLGPHVHFTVTYRDDPMNPAEFLSLG